MSQHNNFTRALSPLAASIAAASSAEEEDKDHARRAPLLSANSVEDLVAMVPSDFRNVLRDPLHEVAALTGKLCSAREVLARLRQHQAAGTFPSNLRAKAPEVQVSKEFSSSPGNAELVKQRVAGHHEYLTAMLANAVRSRKDDVDFLEAALTPQQLIKQLSPLVVQRTNELLARSKQPVFGPLDEEGEIVIQKWEENKTISDLGTNMLNDVLYYAFRIQRVVEMREQDKSSKIASKKAVAKQVDVDMADGTRPGPSIQSLIDKAVSAAMKKVKAPAQPVRLYSPYPRMNANSIFVSSVARQGQQEWQDKVAFNRKHQARSEEVPLTSSSLRSSRWTQNPQDCQENRLGQGQGQGKGRSRLFATEEKVTFRYDMPATYPDWLLTVPLPQAVRFVILNTPLEIIEASQFKNTVHRSPGVTLPEHIEYQLSVGMRYMFYSPRNAQLIRDAWTDFQRRLRWRLFFAFTEEDTGTYDPDYEVVGRQSNIQPPNLPHYLELGLVAGRRFVNSTIASIPPENDLDHHRSLTPSPRLIQKFLVENNYVVTNTDKNLGIAVSERTWLVENTRKLLDNSDDYREVMEIMINSICDSQCTKMELIACEAEAYLSNGKQLAAFLRSKITPARGKHHIPTFYGIPKIHKEPVKMRPILPCFNAIQNPAAKYVSKKLKPIIQSAPTIIHGSKDLAIKLSKVRLLPNRQWFIVTGDVVAFYPNIPLGQCIDIVTDLHTEHYYSANANTPEVVPSEEALREEKIFIDCLRIGNENLVCQHTQKFYRQTRGLAMGVADSPDLANLYGYYFERRNGILNHPQIPFYGRYIDDCLAIVYASSDREAINVVAGLVKFDGCQIEWSASDHFQNFLDMTIYRDPADNRIQHMPFRKARNHQERIPWISHHPRDVKRGTYLGELSRLAALSSRIDHYSDAVKGLAALYCKRGYPHELVQKWTRENFAVRWQKRLEAAAPRASDAEHDAVLVLKSEYNTAWNYFSAKELGDTVLGYWRDYCCRAESGTLGRAGFPVTSADDSDLRATPNRLRTVMEGLEGPLLVPDIRKINILNSRVIVSRKRTKNLFDLTSLWKKTVISTLEGDIVNSITDDFQMDEADEPPRSPTGPQPGDLEYIYRDVLAGRQL